MGQHKSTRNRCNTCKIRKVKCDGKRPACSQCLRQAHICSYNTSKPGYGSSLESVITFDEPVKATSEASAIEDGESTSPPIYFQPIGQSCSPFDRFTLRTGPSLFATFTGALYPKILLQLSHNRPYLKHAVLTVTITHDWTIHGSDCPNAAVIQAYHTSACAKALHDRLSRPLNDVDRDALWASAALLMCASIAGMKHDIDQLDDLDWIHVCRRTANLALNWKGLTGGRLLMCWLRPQRCSPNIRPAGPAAIETQMLDNAIENSISEALYGEDENVMCMLSASLQTLMRMDCRTDTIFNFLAWFGVWPDPLLQRVRERQPCAMLVLAVWCAKTCDFRWWLSRRTLAILRETCDYFERHEVQEANYQILLQYCKISYERLRVQTSLPY